MLLLYPSWANGVVLENVIFTFHYASTISPLCTARGLKCLILYIPLCFYYYIETLSKVLFSANSFTFHYASTISWSWPILCTRSSDFTFHYASTISVCFNSQALCNIRLYIPLCFYYILPPGWSDSCWLPPLHSTMLLLYPNPATPILTRWLFTFHYASTISKTCSA